jgi:glycosyl transferase, family 25
MKAYVINVEHSRERMAHMTSVLSILDIAFERFDAIYGARIDEHPLARIVGQNGYRPLGLGEVGCLLSHIEVWRLVAAGSDEFAAIFEDDVFLDSRLPLLLQGPQLFPPGADVVKLDTHSRPTYLAHREYPGPESLRFRRLRSRHYGSAAYILSRSAARRLLERPALFNTPVDAALFEPQHTIGRSLKVFQVFPAVAIQAMLTPEGRDRAAMASSIVDDRAAALSVPREVRKRKLREVPARAVQLVRDWRLRFGASRLVVPVETKALVGLQGVAS